MITMSVSGSHIRSTKANRIISRLNGEIADDIILELELMGLALATGIMDATTFTDYHVFVSNQTGNTALLAVGALHLNDDLVRLQNVGISLGLFVAGGVTLGQLGNALGPRRRLWLIVTNVLQTALVIVATCLRWKCNTIDGTSGSLIVLSLLAFASGAQIAVARTVNVPEITTAMVTSAYVDLVVDPRIFATANRSRNRRFFFICCLLFGSFVGAIGYRYVGPSLSLLLSAICKLVITMAFFANSDTSTSCTGTLNKCEASSSSAPDNILQSVGAARDSAPSVRSVRSAPPCLCPPGPCQQYWRP
jgi:uncharacterized membrane protein YoaK (UPF0700 family)